MPLPIATANQNLQKEALERRAPEEILREPRKEVTATWVAISIVVIFGVSTLAALIGGFVMLVKGLPPSAAPADVQKVVNESAIPYLERVGTFASTVFGPLLAFILGYYFGEKKT